MEEETDRAPRDQPILLLTRFNGLRFAYSKKFSKTLKVFDEKVADQVVNPPFEYRGFHIAARLRPFFACSITS